jgi:hypothetical protein
MYFEKYSQKCKIIPMKTWMNILIPVKLFIEWLEVVRIELFNITLLCCIELLADGRKIENMRI